VRARPGKGEAEERRREGDAEEMREAEECGGSGAVALQHPQHCATGRTCCILQQEVQQLLDLLHYLLFLHFGDAASFAQAVGDSLTPPGPEPYTMMETPGTHTHSC
jgi:hypothetical protein